MLERLHIRNYRVFNELEIDKLSRINLIAGKNNSGKTSLLEAIFLLAGGGNAQLAVNGHINRGIGLDPDSTVGETFWKPLFSKLDMSRPIEITGHYKPLGQLALKIASERPDTTKISLDRAGGMAATNIPGERSLVFEYSGPKGRQAESRIREKGEEFEFKPPDEIDIPFLAAILLSKTGNIQQDAQLLGRLRRHKQGQVLLEALQTIEPRLQSIEDNSSSGTPMIWGDIGLPELMPLSAMGEGMTRIARLVLAISATPDGLILIDEIENGLHHSVLSKVWKVVDAAAKQFDAQIFATTHSFECIEAAHEALGEDGFLLHRLEVSSTENRCVIYEPEEIDVALRHNLEIR